MPVHSTATPDTTSHHRVPPFAARTLLTVASSSKTNPAASDKRMENTAVAAAAGRTARSARVAVKPHLFTLAAAFMIMTMWRDLPWSRVSPHLAMWAWVLYRLT